MSNVIISVSELRSGTTSLQEALSIMGLKVVAHCPVTNDYMEAVVTAVRKTGVTPGVDAVVSSYITPSVAQEWVDSFPDSKFIYCRRNEIHRLASLARLSKEKNLLLDDRYNGIDRLASFAVLKDNITPENLLILPVELDSKAKWERLQDFLGIEVDTSQDFPHSNKT